MSEPYIARDGPTQWRAPYQMRVTRRHVVGAVLLTCALAVGNEWRLAAESATVYGGSTWEGLRP